MIPRLLNISKNNSFFLFGARGTGKSTLLKQRFCSENLLTLDLLLPQFFDPLLRDPQDLLAQIRAMPKANRWILIDEVQKLPALLDIVHYAIENENAKFALTGSSARKLKRGQANLLAGRAFVYNLFPFSHLELRDNFSLNEALNYGTLPKLLDFSSSEDKELFLTGYTHTYLKEEIVSEQVIRSLPPFRKFLEIAAQMNGKLINFSSIASDVGVDDKTIKSYFQILEDTLIGFFLESYHKSIRKTQLKSPKFYFFDCGVKRALQGILSSPLLESSYAYGDAFEHFIITEIVRLNSYYRKNYKFFYVKVQGGAEIDLIIERPDNSTLYIEIKSTTNIREDHTKHLQNLPKHSDNISCICLSNDSTKKKFNQILCLPWKEGIEAIFS